MGSELDPTALFSLRSGWRGCRPPLDVAINASVSAEAAEEEGAEAGEAGAGEAGADGSSHGGDGGGGDGHESQPSCVRKRL